MVRSVGAYGMDFYALMAQRTAAKTNGGKSGKSAAATSAEVEDVLTGTEETEESDNTGAVGGTGDTNQADKTDKADDLDESEDADEIDEVEEEAEEETKSGRTKSLLVRTVEAMEAAGITRIGWSTLGEYRQTMEKNFMSDMREALRKLGVDEDIQFNLVANADGSVSVVTKHADKGIIEAYLADNPDVAEEFLEIQALASYQRGTKSLGLSNSFASVAEMRASFQSQALNAFFNADSSSQIASFSSNSDMISQYMSLNLSV